MGIEERGYEEEEEEGGWVGNEEKEVRRWSKILFLLFSMRGRRRRRKKREMHPWVGRVGGWVDVPKHVLDIGRDFYGSAAVDDIGERV